MIEGLKTIFKALSLGIVGGGLLGLAAGALLGALLAPPEGGAGHLNGAAALFCSARNAAVILAAAGLLLGFAASPFIAGLIFLREAKESA